MPARKSPPERKTNRSGSYVPDDLRGTVRLVVRCTPELAARARRAARDTGRTLAELLELALDTGHATQPVRDSLESYREDRDDLAELRADMHPDED